MLFKDLSAYLTRLEDTASRNSMIEILSDLFSKASANDIDKMVYLLQGRVAPLYVALEFGMADKMMLKAIALAYDVESGKLNKLNQKAGDLGIITEELAREKGHKGGNVSIEQAYDILKKVAETGGNGSVEEKVKLVSDLLKELDPLSARFVVRIPVGKMRLGFSDMTVLDSLSWMLSGSKKERPNIEKAYNVRPDLGLIAKTIKEKGVSGLLRIEPTVFNPILMARAERLSSGKEILEKIGECAVEPKFDGFRLQAHYDGKQIKLFTRNLEDATFMYPDVVEGIKKQIKAKKAIFEGEAIAYNPNTNEFLPFQETVQRKRKYGIEEMVKTVPLKFILFDVLYVDGKSLIGETYLQRRKVLQEILRKGDSLVLSQERVVDSADQIDNEFNDAITKGLEGIVAKRLEGTYQAGARSWNWIKFKRSYAGKLEDTIDALVMGYYEGRGKRTAFGIGAFLIGVYDKSKDMFVTIARVGTGLTDEEWRTLFSEANKIKTNEKPALYEVDKMLAPDVWTKPGIVVEIRADEITRSPIHTAGRVLKPSKSGDAFDVDIPGFALRFPRLERFRDDKKPEDATSIKEIEDMFEEQRSHKVKT